MQELIFTQSYLLFLLLVIPVIILCYFMYWRKLDGYMVVSNLSSALKETKSSFNPKVVLFMLRICCLVCIIIALADPIIVTSTKKIMNKQDVSFVLALDVSGSMLIEDLKPNRIEALKEVINNFITTRQQDNIGLVLYAGESVTYAPLTKDTRHLLNKVSEMEDYEMEDGTAIGLGLASAINAIMGSKSKNKVIILLTDGENNAGFIHPLTAATLAKKNNIKVYTIALGTKGKVPMPIVEMDGSKHYIYLNSKLDEVLLSQIAENTGGKYFKAVNKNALQAIYMTIDGLEKTQKFIEYKKTISSKYGYFIFTAIALLMLEMTLGFTHFKTLVA